MRQNTVSSETTRETAVRQPSLKALARKALQRDDARDKSETTAPEAVRQTRDENEGFVSPSQSATRERLLILAREIGVPDRVVMELPQKELQATHDQLPFWPDAEMQRHVLMFYLRSLAGIEPALPGSLAARDQARHIP
ncbi:MAG TPA: hypothetical protein VN693_06495 [Rhodanobacteraceae bacterium]|nr:hypothetical protein [Rhodanobacteraceae bacterium]